MIRPQHWLWVLWYTLGVSVVPALAANEDPLFVTVQSPPMVSTEHGYIPYRVTIQNRSNQSHVISLRLPGQVYSTSSSSLHEIRRDAVVGPRSTIEVQLLQPPLSVNGSGLAVYVDGVRRRDPVVVSFADHARNLWRGRQKAFFVLLSARLSRQVEPAMSRFTPKKKAARHAPSPKSRVEWVPAEIPINQWSTQWLGFSAYDGVILTESEFNQLPPKVRTALQRYVEVGGVLLILGPAVLPPSWHAPRPTAHEPFDIYDVGFGQVLVNAASDFEQWPKATWTFLQELWGETAEPFATRRNVQEANQNWPVVDHANIPARTLLLMTVCFALVIGPINLLILHRKQRKIWMLWTVPLISLITSAGIFVAATAKEGWRGFVRTTSVTQLDQRTQHATTLGYTAFYSPLTPRQGLVFDRHTELTPQFASGRNDRTTRWLDWTNQQHLASGWLHARVPAHIQIRKSQTRQERLNLVRHERGSPAVVNGLGVDIESLMVADHDGQIYTAQKVKAGAKVTLEIDAARREVLSDRPQWPLRKLYVQRWEDHIPDLIVHAHQALVPGSYVAQTNQPLFVEPGLQPHRAWRQKAVIYGIFQSEASDAH